MILKGCSCYYSLGFKMSIVVLIEQSYKVCSKTVLIQTFIPNGLKWCFPHIQMGMNHMCQSHITLHSLTFDVDFDFCLTFSWNFFVLHMNMSLCLLYSSLIFDQFYDIKYMFKICAHVVWEYALNVWNLQFPKLVVNA